MASLVGLVSGKVSVLESVNAHYVEFTRRIPAVEMVKIERTLDGLEPKKVSHFNVCMREPPEVGAMRGILSSEEAPYYALRALREERLSVGEVATICRLHAALGHKDAKLHFVFDDLEYAKKMVVSSGAYSQEVRKPDHRYISLTKEEAELYFQTLAIDTSPIDLFYVVFPDDQPMPETLNGVVVRGPTISQRIYQIGTSFLGISDELEDSRVRIAASFGMMVLGLAAKTPEPCMPNPVLGLSSLEDIRKGQEGGVRDLAIPFPGVTLPDEADTFPADDIGFTYHDFSHLSIVSHIPKTHRERFMAISRALEQYGDSVERVEAFADLDFPVYRRRWVSRERKFWFSVFDGLVITHETAKLAPKEALEIIFKHAGDELLGKLPHMRDYLMKKKSEVESMLGSEGIAAVFSEVLELIEI